MGFVDESGCHEGYLVAVFPDGATGSGWSNGGITVTESGDGKRLPVDAWTSRPGADVVGWQIRCDCTPEHGYDRITWQSDRAWTRVRDPREHDLDAGKIYATDVDAEFLSDQAEVEDAIRRIWNQHVEPETHASAIRAAARDVAAATTRLDQAVAEARAVGVSWAHIGHAAGITRQSAHTRWAAR